jgi:F-type H+-transporting ATPase subunit delta
MAELSTIARPYAEALYRSATAAGPGAAAQWLPALDALAGLVDQPAVTGALSNPRLNDENRLVLLTGLAGVALPAPVTELLRLVLQNERLAALPQIVAQFHELKNGAEGIADCLIESAFPMSAEETAGLVAALRRKFPVQLKPEVRINPELIGGVRVTVGDRVLDSSVRARLDDMRARLTA